MAELARVMPKLIAFSDTTRAAEAVLLERFARLAALARARSVLFVLRDYGLPLRARFRLGTQLATLAMRTEQGFGLADRADLARALRCSAFHLPRSGLTARDARAYLGAQVFLSRGSHDPQSEPEAELDAVLLSPIFEARKGRPALGVEALASARARVRTARALFALGGVDAHNAASCLAAGASGVAVIGAALAADPKPLLAALGILRG